MTAKNDVTRISDRLWYRKTMRKLTVSQKERELDRKVRHGDMTRKEAEMEYQDFMHRYEVWSEW